MSGATTLEGLRQEVRRWLARADIPGTPVALDARFTEHRKWQRTLFDAGWIGLDWSVEAGGKGLTLAHQNAFFEELANFRAPAPVGLIGLDVVGPTIDRFATPEQRARFCPPLLSGDEIWCQGFSEPGAGSDLASIRTRAERRGDRYGVSGQKVWTSWGAQADWCGLLCRTDPDPKARHRGLSFLLVDMRSPGITVRPITQMTGDQEFCEVFFDDVEVPVENRLGAEGQGWELAMYTLSRERGTFAVRRRVEVDLMLSDAIAGLRQADPPRALVPRIEQALGSARLSLAVMGALLRATAKHGGGHEGPAAMDSVTKLLLNDTEQNVCAQIVDLLGPFRLSADQSVLGLDPERIVKDHYYSRAISIYGGSAQIQRNIVAERLLGLPKG